MEGSKKQFNRWTTLMKSTWAFQVFNKYNDELNEMLWANLATTRLTYKQLSLNKATWNDSASDHLKFEVPNGEEVFKNLKEWSETYNQFENWINLNALLSISSNFEIYLSTIVSLAIESDPGVLFSSSKSIDGISLLKNGANKSKIEEDIIKAITKGDWNSRTSAFIRVFGSAPEVLKNNISELDKIRNIRNKVGHAFGRDIDESRNHEVKDILPIENLTPKKLKTCQYTILNVVKSIDAYLLNNHIGEFQAIAFYHRMFPGLRKDVHQNQRAVTLKKALGKFGDTSGKEFCKGLVSYYEAL